MSALTEILDTFRTASQSEREKGAYFENLVKVYLQNEPVYKDLFNGKVFLWEEWRRYWMSLGHKDPQADAGIDLVAIEDTPDLLPAVDLLGFMDEIRAAGSEPLLVPILGCLQFPRRLPPSPD